MATRYGTRSGIRRAAAEAAKGLANGTIVATTTRVDIEERGEIRLQDTSGGEYVALRAPSTVSSNVTLTLPDEYGSADDVLTCTDGSGNLEWAAASGGGGGGGVTLSNDTNNYVTTATGSGGINGEANLTFNGSALTVSGSVVVGDGASAGAILSNGNFDLELQTGNSTTGVITIVDGADGDITLSPDGSGIVESSGFLHHEKGIQGAYNAVTGDTTLSDDHFIVQASRSAVITLPAVGSAGRWYFIIRVDDGTSDGPVDIGADGSETIEGNSEYTLETDGDGVALFDNGTQWVVMWERVSPTRAGFSPDTVDHLALWYKGGTGITTDGSGDVTQWADQSGNANHAEQLGSGPSAQSLPTTATVNGITVPSFSTGDVLNVDENVLDDNDKPWTCFIVINTSGTAPASTHIFGTGSSVDGYLNKDEGSGAWGGYGKKIFTDSSSKPGLGLLAADMGLEARSQNVCSGTEVIVAQYSGAGIAKIDGGDGEWYTSFTDLDDDQNYVYLNIGASSGNYTSVAIDGFSGEICEIILYHRDLGYDEIRLVKDYLEDRWL